MPKDAANCFTEDAHGAIWVGSPSGLFRRVGEQGAFTEVKDISGKAIAGVTCLHADEEGSVWIGTLNEGLLRWRSGAVAGLGPGTGFPVSTVHSLAEDDSGFLWMTSGRRIARAHRRDLEAVMGGQRPRLSYQVFDGSDGLPPAEFTAGRQPSIAKDTRGHLWFATGKGVTTVNPSALQLNVQVPPVYIKGISFYSPASPGASPDKDIRQQPRESLTQLSPPPPFSRTIVLPPGSGRIAIRYTALSLAAPEKVEFESMLEILDLDWQEAGNLREASYHQLPPGEYTFRVRAANNDGVWNETGATLAFTLLPRYWETGWFQFAASLLLVMLGGALTWSGAHRRYLRAAERERIAHEMQQLRDGLAHSTRVSTMGQLASSLAHELSQPLGAILRNAEAAELMIKEDHPDMTELSAVLADIRLDDRRAGEVIDRMRSLLKRRKTESAPFDLADLLQETVELIRPDTLRRKVTLTVKLSSDLPEVRGDRVQLQQVLLNLLINGMDAVVDQPSEARRLLLEARMAGERTVQVTVSDTGSGIPQHCLPRLLEPFFSTKAQGMGLGLAVSDTIVKAHGGRLWAENAPDGGARFHFTLPVTGGVSRQAD